MKKVNYNVQSTMRREQKKAQITRRRRFAYLILSGILISIFLHEGFKPNVVLVNASQPKTYETTSEVSNIVPRYIEPFRPTTAPQVELDFNNANYESKKKAIIERLEHNNVTSRDIDTFVSIFELESCRNKNDQGCFNTKKTPRTIVYHCKRPDGSRVAVEIIDRNGIKVQAHCSDYGYETTYQEQSVGLAQILVTTWRGYKCEGDIYNSDYKQQVDCAVKIKNTSGFGAWSTYKLLNK